MGNHLTPRIELMTEDNFLIAKSENNWTVISEDGLRRFVEDIHALVVKGMSQDLSEAEKESIEKANKDISKLTPKQIVDKIGRRRLVYVKMDEAPVKKTHTEQTEENNKRRQNTADGFDKFMNEKEKNDADDKKKFESTLKDKNGTSHEDVWARHQHQIKVQRMGKESSIKAIENKYGKEHADKVRERHESPVKEIESKAHDEKDSDFKATEGDVFKHKVHGELYYKGKIGELQGHVFQPVTGSQKVISMSPRQANEMKRTTRNINDDESDGRVFTDSELSKLTDSELDKYYRSNMNYGDKAKATADFPHLHKELLKREKDPKSKFYIGDKSETSEAKSNKENDDRIWISTSHGDLHYIQESMATKARGKLTKPENYSVLKMKQPTGGYVLTTNNRASKFEKQGWGKIIGKDEFKKDGVKYDTDNKSGASKKSGDSSKTDKEHIKEVVDKAKKKDDKKASWADSTADAVKNVAKEKGAKEAQRELMKRIGSFLR